MGSIRKIRLYSAPTLCVPGMDDGLPRLPGNAADADSAAAAAQRVKADELNRQQRELMFAAVARLARRRELLASQARESRSGGDEADDLPAKYRL